MQLEAVNTVLIGLKAKFNRELPQFGLLPQQLKWLKDDLKKCLLITTASVNEDIATDHWFAKFVSLSIRRFVNLDWGETDPDDAKLNDEALFDSSRILAVYKGYKTIWIIADSRLDSGIRQALTVMYPEEY